MTSSSKFLTPALLALALIPGTAHAVSCDTCPPPGPTNNAPIADFDFPAQLNRSQAATLTDTSTDPDDDAVSVIGWDLDGDGSYTDAPGAHATSVSFGSVGTHTVGIKVSDGRKTATITHTISVVNRTPSVTLVADKTDVRTGADVLLTATGADADGDAVTYQWSFNGGDYLNLSHQVIDSSNKVGPEVVKVRAVDALGAVSGEAQVTIKRANRAPVGHVVVSAEQPFTSQSVDLDATSSTDTDGSIASYQWFFDGDNTIDATGPKATVSYPRAGQRTVKLLLTDDRGAKTLVDVPLTVRNRLPVAVLTSSAKSVATNADVTFDGSASSDPETSVAGYEWDFDDDGVYETDGGATGGITHAFASAGTKVVGLRVTDADGGTATATTEITVTAATGPTPPAVTATPTPTPTTTDPVKTPVSTVTPVPTPDHGVIVDPTPQPTVTPVVKAGPTAPLRARFVRMGKRVRVKTLAITPAAGVTVTVTCAGRGCAFKTRRIVAGGAKVNLKPLFRKALFKGATVSVSLSKDGLAGSSYTKVA